MHSLLCLFYFLLIGIWISLVFRATIRKFNVVRGLIITLLIYYLLISYFLIVLLFKYHSFSKLFKLRSSRLSDLSVLCCYSQSPVACSKFFSVPIHVLKRAKLWGWLMDQPSDLWLGFFLWTSRSKRPSKENAESLMYHGNHGRISWKWITVWNWISLIPLCNFCNSLKVILSTLGQFTLVSYSAEDIEYSEI